LANGRGYVQGRAALQRTGIHIEWGPAIRRPLHHHMAQSLVRTRFRCLPKALIEQALLCPPIAPRAAIHRPDSTWPGRASHETWGEASSFIAEHPDFTCVQVAQHKILHIHTAFNLERLVGFIRKAFEVSRSCIW
jgi:hypothetical protein